jgi:polar amino acid transport system permease protein
VGHVQVENLHPLLKTCGHLAGRDAPTFENLRPLGRAGYTAGMPRWLAHLIVLALVAAAGGWAIASLDMTWNWGVVWEYREAFWKGWWTTVGVALAALLGSLAIGLVTALMLRSRFTLLEAAGRVYVELIRGTPLLVQLLVGWYVVAAAVRVGTDGRGVVGVLVLSLFSGAYMAEIIRGGLDAIPRAQIDSARAIGLTPWQTLRLVVLPQAVRIVLPAVAGQLVSLIKDSSLLSVISIGEFTFAARNVNSATYSTLESYLPLAAGYLALTLPLSALSRWLERRFRYEAA